MCLYFTFHSGGIARKRNSCHDVIVSSHFLIVDFFYNNFFSKENVPKAQEKHFMMAQSDFGHGFGGPQHAKMTENGLFWPNIFLHNGV